MCPQLAPMTSTHILSTLPRAYSGFPELTATYLENFMLQLFRPIRLPHLIQANPYRSVSSSAYTMSWRCSSSTNEGLIENLWKNDLIQTERVKEAFQKVDRANFSKRDPYEDSPQVIGYDATISAPHIHAASVEELQDFLKPGSKVLDIGCGSGYLCAVLAHLVV